jgi:hypothetical protein
VSFPAIIRAAYIGKLGIKTQFKEKLSSRIMPFLAKNFQIFIRILNMYRELPSDN